MKQLFYLTLFLFNSLIMNAQEFNVISYNIRFNTPDDGINAWTNRAGWVTELLTFHDADLFGLQEVLSDQLQYIEQNMTDFERIGVGRDDGKNEGEFSPLFYNKNKFKLIESGHFWLSETPNKPGLGWDAACNRICTWAKLKVKGSCKKVLILNTHFDHRGEIARKESAKFICEQINDLNRKNKLPVILIGDFNLTPDQKPIAFIKQHLFDSREISIETPYGPEATFNGFKFDIEPKDRIDYIFVNDKIKIQKQAVLTDSRNQRYPSDHFPVYAKLLFR